MTDIVVLSLEAWDHVWRRNQHVISGLLHDDPELRVLFVEPAADPLHSLRRGHWPRLGSDLRKIEPNNKRVWQGQLWGFQPTKWLPRRVDPWADARLARAAMGAADQLGMSRPVLWINDPFGAEVLRRTGWPALYDITDDWLLADRTARETRRVVEQEEYLMGACREVVVCSAQLQRDKSNHRRVHLIPNAVDLSQYRTDAPRPRDLPSTPVVMYVGTLHRDRLDIDLCVRLAERITGIATAVFVGPVALDLPERRRLERSGSVLLGARPSTRVPSYLINADVLMVPHLQTAFTESLDPIKAYEYQASGRPVVSTGVPGFRDDKSGLVNVASTTDFPDIVVDLIRQSPEPETPAQVPDWSLRVQQFRNLIRAITP